MKTGESIRDLRLKQGLTQEDLSARTEISVRTIQRIESGEVDPRPYTVHSIAAALGVTFETLTVSEVATDNSVTDTRRWLPILHLSGILVLIFPPLIIWIWKRDQVAGMRKHAYDVLNFQLSMFLYLLPCALFNIYPLLIILAAYSQVLIIFNTIKVTSDQNYKYWLSIRFLKEVKDE